MQKPIALTTILAAGLLSPLALAQDEAAPEAAPPADATPEAAAEPEAPAPAVESPAGYPDAYALRPLTLAGGMFQATLPVAMNLSKDAVLKPVLIPLDLRFGITDQVEVFLSHNAFGMPNAVGGGLCLGGQDRGCPKVYDNLNAGGQLSLLRSGDIELSGLVALEVRQLLSDPLLLAADVGIGFKYVSAPISLKLAPQIGIGLNKRSSTSTEDLGGGVTVTTTIENREVISVPVQLAVQAAPQVAVFLDGDFVARLDDFSNRRMAFVGVGCNYLVAHGLDVGVELLARVLAGEGQTATDARSLLLYAAWRSQ